jgi:tetratricopeptide (TPR) repeat protein
VGSHAFGVRKAANLKRVKRLEWPDNFHLRAAEGWLGLGDILTASAELEEISPEGRANPTVLFMRYEIYARAGRWNMAAAVSEGLTRMLPDEPTAWVFFASATRRMEGGGIAPAMEILLEAEAKFPHAYQFSLNLAGYFAQLNDIPGAEKWFRKAMEIDKDAVRTAAFESQDLKPLWDSMSGMLCKGE